MVISHTRVCSIWHSHTPVNTFSTKRSCRCERRISEVYRYCSHSKRQGWKASPCYQPLLSTRSIQAGFRQLWKGQIHTGQKRPELLSRRSPAGPTAPPVCINQPLPCLFLESKLLAATSSRCHGSVEVRYARTHPLHHLLKPPWLHGPDGGTLPVILWPVKS